MTSNLREHSQLAVTAIRDLAAIARQSVGEQLRLIKNNLPDGFRNLPAAECREMTEELRAGYIAWSSEINPIAAELRELLRELQDLLWTVNYREGLGANLAEEEDMPGTQTARDRKAERGEL